jgi:predicted DNA-binding transcriptional regulator AlpA
MSEHVDTATLRELVQARGGIVVQADVAAMLEVTRQRVGQLIRDHADFPAPFDTIGPDKQRVWLRDDIREWHQRRRRRLQKRRQRGSPGAAKIKTTP